MEHNNISIIVAIAENNAIGKNNDLLFYLPQDLKRFKALTTGNTIIMGRKTYESLPNGALPNRRNVVVTTQKGLELPKCDVVHSIEDALTLVENDSEAFVIGGAEIYKQCLPFANRLYLTKVEKEFDADTFFPAFDDSDWIVEKEEVQFSEKNNFEYKYIDLIRNK